MIQGAFLLLLPMEVVRAAAVQPLQQLSVPRGVALPWRRRHMSMWRPRPTEPSMATAREAPLVSEA